jgi:eukaryotic-like serine/threonine-protein kinase
MTTERWQQISALYHAALDRSTDERHVYLKDACSGDDGLRHEVEALLAADAGPALVDEPAIEAAARAIAHESEASLIGRHVGAYEITGFLGAGGMGEVYRARDRRLGRDVAIKMLAESFAANPQWLARLHREAKLLAALNHPNIGAIYGVEESGDISALVLELVEGPTLADLLTRRLNFDEILCFTNQIVDALEAAHERGVIHRDLKPSNIKVTQAGTVKVLDFGLAKSTGPSGLANESPVPRSSSGLILGTAAYMSPEQARGLPVDKRADIWAFGCVLYEMCSGKLAFAGDTVSDSIAAILTREPDWTALQADTPPGVRRLLRRCLVKNTKRRLRDIGDARVDLEETDAGDVLARSPTKRLARSSRWLWAVSGVCLVAVIAVAATRIASRGQGQPADFFSPRFEVQTGPTTEPLSFALSPDGRKLAYVAEEHGLSKLWVRPLDQTSAKTLSGTEGATYPFWSHDGRSIGFFAEGKLKRIDVSSGERRVLTDASSGRGGTWNDDDVIVFAPTTAGPLMRISAIGGTPSAVTQLGPGQPSHRWPEFLPDGRHFMFVAPQAEQRAEGILVGALDGAEPKRLVDDEVAGLYARSSGFQGLLVARAGALVALGFEPARVTASGPPVAIAPTVGLDSQLGRAAFSASESGVLAYRAGLAERRQLVWVDRSGRVTSTLGPADDTALSTPVLAHDGRRLALFRSVEGNTDIWTMQLAGGVLSRFTFHPRVDLVPLWSSDDDQILFTSNRRGTYDLYEKSSTGADDERSLLISNTTKAPLDVTSDGKLLLYAEQVPETGVDIWAMSLTGHSKPFPVVQTPFDEMAGQLSPDGRWVAYQSNASGRMEVHVQAFREATRAGAQKPEGQWTVSPNGGTQPRWSADGKELFYVAADSRMMAVPIHDASEGRTLDPGSPVPLFVTHLATGINVPPAVGTRAQYAVSRDGRFLLNESVEGAAAPPITIVLNWAAGLRH